MTKFNGSKTQRFPSMISPKSKTGLELLMQPSVVIDLYVRDETTQAMIISTLEAMEKEGTSTPDQVNIFICSLVHPFQVWNRETLIEKSEQFHRLLELEARTEKLLGVENKNFENACNRIGKVTDQIRALRTQLQAVN